MLGEFFFCDHDEIEETLLATGPNGRHPTVAAKGLSPVDLANLGEILGVFDETAQVHHESASGGSGVWEVPGSLVGALVDSTDLAEVAERWSETDELRMSGWNAATAAAVLADLKTLATARGGKPLWYWWSL